MNLQVFNLKRSMKYVERVNLPEEAKEMYDELKQDYSYASYAIRFAASFDGMYKVLSGMSNFEQLKDNVD